MKTRVAGGVVAIAFFVLQASAQVGVWKNYTSMQQVRAVAPGGNTFWAATSGGLFAWLEGSETYTRYTNADGLQSTDLTAIAVTAGGDIITGASTGILHSLSPASGTWRYVPDIANSNQTNKQINSLSVFGDTLLICSGFGLSVFHIRDFQFGDTYTKFGNVSGSVRISVSSAALYNGRIWAIISDGQSLNQVASASLALPNLIPPEVWTLQTIGSGSTVPKQLAVFNGSLYASTTTGLFVFDGTGWVAVPAFPGRNIAALATSSTRLLLVGTDRAVDTLSTQNTTGHIGTVLPSDPSSAALSVSGKPIIGVNDQGLLSYSGTQWVNHFPNGPAANQFVSITVDNDGRVWGASGFNTGGKGFYRFDGKTWKSFSRQNAPIPTNDYYRASTACNGDVWLSSWGRGVTLIPRGSDNVDSSKIYGRNVGLSGILDDSTFVVVGSAVCDARGNTWMPVMKVRNKRALAVRKPDGTWNTLPVYIGGVPHIYLTERQVTRPLAIDASNNVWTTAVTTAPLGIACLNNKGSITDSIAETFISTAEGLPSSAVTTIVVDKENDIWVGTEKGIAIILDPDNPLRSGGIASYKPLFGVNINAIAVDPLNQKWIATNDGVIVLSRDGTQTIAQYNVLNTAGKLINNQIQDIAIDGASGTVYFATNSGLASLTTTAAQPNQSFEKLLISPNPYRIPNSTLLTIDGLIINSKIKILTVDGRLVRELQTPGGRIGFWDGKDDSGKDVASGIYLVIGYSDADKNTVGKGKVAVLRK